MDKLTEDIINQVQSVFSKPVYLVGGPIRNHILGIPIIDYDFCTPLLPDDIEKEVKAAGRRAFVTGKRFGTVGFKVMVDKKPYPVEITTFRTEEYEDGNRKPTVAFVDNIDHDLSRRDFTMNAIAFRDGKFIDPYKGKEDIQNKLIRAVGKPSARFKEDPLRMLRVARFASQLNFTVDSETQAAMLDKPHRILMVSKERWVSELDKLLMSPNPSKGLDLLMDTRVMNFIIPELAIQKNYNQNSKYHKHDLWTHTKLVVEKAPNTIECKWAALLHDIAKPFVKTTDITIEKVNKFTDEGEEFEVKQPLLFTHYIKHDLVGAEMVDKIALYLKWSNDRHQKVRELVLNHLQDDCPIRQADKEAH